MLMQRPGVDGAYYYIIMLMERISSTILLVTTSPNPLIRDATGIFNSHERIVVFLLQTECQCSSKSSVNNHRLYSTMAHHLEGRREE